MQAFTAGLDGETTLLLLPWGMYVDRSEDGFFITTTTNQSGEHWITLANAKVDANTSALTWVVTRNDEVISVLVKRRRTLVQTINEIVAAIGSGRTRGYRDQLHLILDGWLSNLAEPDRSVFTPVILDETPF